MKMAFLGLALFTAAAAHGQTPGQAKEIGKGLGGLRKRNEAIKAQAKKAESKAPVSAPERTLVAPPTHSESLPKSEPKAAGIEPKGEAVPIVPSRPQAPVVDSALALFPEKNQKAIRSAEDEIEQLKKLSQADLEAEVLKFTDDVIYQTLNSKGAKDLANLIFVSPKEAGIRRFVAFRRLFHYATSHRNDGGLQLRHWDGLTFAKERFEETDALYRLEIHSIAYEYALSKMLDTPPTLGLPSAEALKFSNQASSSDKTWKKSLETLHEHQAMFHQKYSKAATKDLKAKFAARDAADKYTGLTSVSPKSE